MGARTGQEAAQSEPMLLKRQSSGGRHVESSRAVRRFTDSAQSGHEHRHSGDGWAERHLEATNYGLPCRAINVAGQDNRQRYQR